MILYHGSDKRIRNLRVGSYLTTEPRDAAQFAHAKEGGSVYEFHVSPDSVERDDLNQDVEWYTNKIKLQPVRIHQA